MSASDVANVSQIFSLKALVEVVNISVGAKSYNALTFCITCRPDKICSEQRPGLPIACTLTWLSTGQTITLLLDNDNSFF